MPFELPDVSSTLVFNGLIVLLGIPALALIAGGEFLRRADTVPPTLTHIGLTAVVWRSPDCSQVWKSPMW